MSKQLDIAAKDIKTLLLRTYRGLKTGELSDSQAYREVFILNSILKAIELTDIQERLGKIERVLSE
jgi:hypothetical protein